MIYVKGKTESLSKDYEQKEVALAGAKSSDSR